jgi:predicted ATP-dependent endonuclease of OLD family
MRLLDLKVIGFRSVANELTLRVRPKLTCLIGANEHGKSNLLDAINFLDGLVFDSNDKNTNSALSTVPGIRFRLEISKTERLGLIKELEDELSKPSSEDVQEQKTRNFVRNARDYFASGKSEVVQYMSSKSSRTITIPGIVVYSNFKPRTTSQPQVILRWLSNNLPRVRLFAAPNDLTR